MKEGDVPLWLLLQLFISVVWVDCEQVFWSPLTPDVDTAIARCRDRQPAVSVMIDCRRELVRGLDWIEKSGLATEVPLLGQLCVGHFLSLCLRIVYIGRRGGGREGGGKGVGERARERGREKGEVRVDQNLSTFPLDDEKHGPVPPGVPCAPLCSQTCRLQETKSRCSALA